MSEELNGTAAVWEWRSSMRMEGQYGWYFGKRKVALAILV